MRPLVAALALAACHHAVAPPVVSPIPATTTQLVTAVVDDWTTTRATLRAWHREGASWAPIGEAWPAVIGKTGTAWGAGLHGAGPPAGRTGPVKREGDARPPAGVFALRASFGYAPAAPTGSRFPYTPVDDNWQCVDDVSSSHYTQILDRRGVTVDWTSAEQMHRPDEAYTWVVDVAHNPAHASGAGSCIFLHVWRGPDSATLGCTAMEEPHLASLIAGLDPGASPVYVLLPRSEYQALARAWGLPPL
jgi:D-alanyl-D-alanine dipeptidase